MKRMIEHYRKIVEMNREFIRLTDLLSDEQDIYDKICVNEPIKFFKMVCYPLRSAVVKVEIPQDKKSMLGIYTDGIAVSKELGTYDSYNINAGYMMMEKTTLNILLYMRNEIAKKISKQHKKKVFLKMTNVIAKNHKQLERYKRNKKKTVRKRVGYMDSDNVEIFKEIEFEVKDGHINVHFMKNNRNETIKVTSYTSLDKVMLIEQFYPALKKFIENNIKSYKIINQKGEKLLKNMHKEFDGYVLLNELKNG